MEVLNFNIRVYGLFVKNSNILVSDEFRIGTRMTKFPGGGLEPGEGTLDCLKRECMEEMGVEPEIVEHFYTTDYYQPTQLIKPGTQLISIYYLMRINNTEKLSISNTAFDYGKETEGAIGFRWLPLQEIYVQSITFPIDRRVFLMLCQKSITNS